MAQLSGTRQAIATACAGVTGGGYTMNAARVKLGYFPTIYNTASPGFLASLAGTGNSTSGPWLVIKSGSMTALNPNTSKMPDYEIYGDLYFGIDLNATNDFKNIEDFIYALAIAIKGAAYINDVSFTWNEKDLRNNPATVHYEILIKAAGCT